MKRKLVPPFIMLLAGAVTSIVMFLNHYEIKKMLWILVAVLVSFYIIGVVIKEILDSFDKEDMENKLSEEGKVIEKEGTEEYSEEEQKEQQDKK